MQKATLIQHIAHEKEYPELGESFVLFDQNKIVAWARTQYCMAPAIGPSNAIPEGWYLLGVNVLQDYRRQGLAHALTRFRLNRLCDRIQRVLYFTSVENTASMAMHHELGFKLSREDVWFARKEQDDAVFNLYQLEHWSHTARWREDYASVLKLIEEQWGIYAMPLSGDELLLFSPSAHYKAIKRVLDFELWRYTLDAPNDKVYCLSPGLLLILRKGH